MIRVSRLTCAIGALLFASGVGAQDYPTKPITFVVPFAAGSATDQLARALGQSVSEQGKQAVVVDNKPGASGFLAAQFVAKASPDGHTVLITTNTTHAANEHLYKSMPYDPVKDFAPVTLLGKGGQIMIVNPKVQAKTVGEFLQSLDFFLLVFVGGQLLFVAFLALAQEIRIIPGISYDLLISNFMHLADDFIHKLAVMRNEQQRAGVVFEVIL